MNKTIPAGLVLALVSTSVYAHTGYAGHGFLSGFAHPFSGADHLLVMLCLGLWAATIGGAARWQLPLTFMSIMAISTLSGMLLPSSALEIGIAASVVAIGLLLAMRLSVNRSAQFALAGLFAMLHGLAHGVELDLSGGRYVIFGMVLATGLLHAAGLLLAAQSLKIRRQMYTLFGWLVVLVGGGMLLAAT